VFNRARGSYLFDQQGRRYLDFLAGAGTLSYGHNNPLFKRALLAYIERDGITHGLDMQTQAKAEFLKLFDQHILKPRNLDYVVQFTGPTGTNAVEAALKLARKVTGRHNVIAFTNGFHGVTLGAAAATGNAHHRGAAGLPLSGVTRMPFDGYLDTADTSVLLAKMLDDASSGVDKPAAIILETVQGEGGLNVASVEWLRSVERICRRHGALLIVDDIQAGCGRTGAFFSFERAGITPDIVTLSKALSGYGLPMALTLIRKRYDEWKPGQHNGTFRGNNHAFITASAALREYWSDVSFAKDIQHKANQLEARLQALVEEFPEALESCRGLGMMQGVVCRSGELAERVTREAFVNGLVIETSGPDSEVVKCLCPLTITETELHNGLDILANSIRAVAAPANRPMVVPRLVGSFNNDY
jgi:diaminobutyrate-2-oxoglutarate transaminase